MDAFLTAVNATLPSFFLVALGAFADRLFPQLSIETLSKLSVQIFIPALMFNALVATSLSLSAALLLSLGYLTYLFSLGLVSWLASYGLSTTQKRGVMATALFGNTGNMGLPITLFAYGQAGLERAVVIFVISIIAMFAIGPTILSGSGESLAKRFWNAVRLPPFWATLIGVFFNVLQMPVPELAARSINLLSGAAIPVMLISLGIQMRRSWVWDVGGAAIRSATVRLLIGPFIALAVASVLNLEALDSSVLILSAAMPAAVTMFVVAVEVKGDYVGVAKSVVATTVLSLFIIMAVIFFFPIP